MTNYQPDYQNLVKAAKRQKVDRIPLYDHIVAVEIMEKVLGTSFAELNNGDTKDVQEYFRYYCEFFRRMQYDTVSYEGLFRVIMPGGGALIRAENVAIRDRKDYEQYPFNQLEEIYFATYQKNFTALRDQLPTGIKVVGGVGNGIFECVQDLTGYINLCYMGYEDPDLYRDMFTSIGDVMVSVWRRLLREFGDIFCVCRMGDDLGFRTSTLLSPDDVCTHIIPQYKRIISMVHEVGKPFLLHSCGRIFPVMDDLIAAGIDVKHSNEDAIAPFEEWVNRYGNKIGLFGGIDTDRVCRLGRQEMTSYIRNLFDHCADTPGWAFGSGNSIPKYVPVEQYLVMNEIARGFRDEIAEKRSK